MNISNFNSVKAYSLQIWWKLDKEEYQETIWWLTIYLIKVNNSH